MRFAIWILIPILAIASGVWFVMLRMPGTRYVGAAAPLTQREVELRDSLRRDVETLAGEIVIELNARGRVIVAVLDVTDPRVAVIETGLLLGASTVATPALVMLTAVGLLEFQLTVAVMSFVVPSLYVPVAVYC